MTTGGLPVYPSTRMATGGLPGWPALNALNALNSALSAFGACTQYISPPIGGGLYVL